MKQCKANAMIKTNKRKEDHVGERRNLEYKINSPVHAFFKFQ